MQMATKTRRRIHRWTSADLVRLPDDGNRYEVLDGELFVTPQARYQHQRIATRLVLALEPYCARHALGGVVGPGAVVFGKNELQPDVQVVPGAEPSVHMEWKDLPTPLLVAEVVSDSTERRDFGKKRDAYVRIGIPTYWVIDAEHRRVHVWTSADLTRGGGATAPVKHVAAIPGDRVTAMPADSEPTIITDVLRWQPRADVPPLEIPLEAFLPRAGS